MKTGLKTATILTVLLTSAIVVGAHPHQNQQRQGRQNVQRKGPHQRQGGQRPNCKKQNNRCNQMQSPNKNKQGQRPQQWQEFNPRAEQNQRRPAPQQRQRFQQPQGNQQVQGRQAQPQRPVNPQQRQQIQMRKQQILKEFDRNGDGQLSEKERKAARKSFEKLLGGDQRKGAGQPKKKQPPVK